MSKFTPGPWKSIMKFSPVRYGCYDVLANDVRIANIIHFGKTDEEAFANARLIAAVPEMYEAVEHLILVAMNYYLRLQSEQKIVSEDLEMRTVKYWIDKGNALLRRIDREEEPE